MNSASSSQITALKKAARDKQRKTLARIREAFELMKKEGIPITFESVARHASVSKTVLYGDPKIREQIKKAREFSLGVKGESVAEEKKEGAKDKEILLLRGKNEVLSKEVKGLKTQLAVVYGELYKQGKE